MIWEVWRQGKSLAPSENWTTIPWLAIPSLYVVRTSRLQCWLSSSCWLSVQEDSSQEFGAVKSPRQLAVDLQLQQGGVGQGRTDISSVGKPWPTYFSPPNVRSMSNTNHFYRMFCDILVACPCVQYPWTAMSSSSPTQEYSTPLQNVFPPAFSRTWGAWILGPYTGWNFYRRTNEYLTPDVIARRNTSNHHAVIFTDANNLFCWLAFIWIQAHERSYTTATFQQQTECQMSWETVRRIVTTQFEMVFWPN
jgi:hypothetical protein